MINPPLQTEPQTEYPFHPPNPYTISPLLNQIHLESPLTADQLQRKLSNTWETYYQQELQQVENTLHCLLSNNLRENQRF